MFLDREYTSLRLVKSGEELARMRAGAAMSDDAVAALAAAARPGMTEAECCAALEGAYLAAGGLTHIHYLGVTAMAEPSLCVPAQWPSPRRLRAGDVLTCEVSASYQGYPGQLLRTFTIAAPATPLYEASPRRRGGVRRHGRAAAGGRGGRRPDRGGRGDHPRRRVHDLRRPGARLRGRLPAAGDLAG